MGAQLAAANTSEWRPTFQQQQILDMFPFPVAGQIVLAIVALIVWRHHNCKWFTDIHEEAKSGQHQHMKIDKLDNFDLNSAEPPNFRPFKPKYHLTMGLETLSPGDFLIFDKTYSERLNLRKSLVEQHPEDVIGITDDTNARIRLAVQELYSYLFKTYLPSRYPSIFKARCDKTDSLNTVENLVTGSIIPADAESISLHAALKIISENIDEDFFILLPHHVNENSASDEDVYVLEAYSACFPSGFQPRDKIGKKLADIHGPVPKYKEKLQKSMDRFFARLEAGRLVKRVNWAITVDEELYSNFDKSGPAFEGTLTKMTVDDLDLNKTFLRSERQTLHRLPASDAIVFAFHTYLYPIQDIKTEGSAEDLALAIDGLQSGSVPEIFTYKNGEKWADAVKQYLRS